MTIGPEPITRTRFKSIRLGICQTSRGGADTRSIGINKPVSLGAWASLRLVRQLSTLLDFIQELAEQVVGVVRAGRCFGMILHREHRLALVAEPLERPVVQVHVR